MTNSPAAPSGSKSPNNKRRRRRNPSNRRPNAPRVASNTPNSQQQGKKVMADWKPEDYPVAAAEGKLRFADLQLPNELLRSISEQGFDYCTPIQAQSLFYTLHGVDLIGKAQTGTGKTAAFLIAILTYLLEEKIPEGQKIDKIDIHIDFQNGTSTTVTKVSDNTNNNETPEVPMEMLNEEF